MATNALDYVPKGLSQEEASEQLRAAFQAPNRSEADRSSQQMAANYAETAPKLATWLETNIPEGLTVFNAPTKHRRRLRTNKVLEWLNRELKRRSRVASLFPNDASLLRLATAVLMEVDEKWQTQNTYLSMRSA